MKDKNLTNMYIATILLIGFAIGNIYLYLFQFFSSSLLSSCSHSMIILINFFVWFIGFGSGLIYAFGNCKGAIVRINIALILVLILIFAPLKH